MMHTFSKAKMRAASARSFHFTNLQLPKDHRFGLNRRIVWATLFGGRIALRPGPDQYLVESVGARPGDCPVRAISALTSHLQLSSLWSENGLTSPWPKGHRLLIGTLTRLLANGSDSFVGIHWYQTLSLTAYASGILLFSLVAWRLHGVWSGLAALLMLLGFRLGTNEAASGMTEVYVFFFSACAITALVSTSRQNTWFLYGAAIANLLASTMRTEIIIISFLQWLFLIGRVRIFHLLAFGFISAAYFLLRLGYSILIYKGPVTFLNKNKTLFDTDTVANTVNMFRYFLDCFGWPLAILASLSIVYGVVGIYRQIRGEKSLAPDCPPRARVSGFFSLLRQVATSAEYFPVRCLLLLLLFMALGLRSGNLEALPRYWIALMPYICLSAAILFSERLRLEPAVARLARPAAILALAAACASSLLSSWKHRDRFDHGELEFINWLRARPGQGAVFDFMRFRDGRYIAYASPIGKNPPYWGRASSNPFGSPREKVDADGFVASETLKDRLSAHANLLDPKCSFLVLASASYFAEGDSGSATDKHHYSDLLLSEGFEAARFRRFHFGVQILHGSKIEPDPAQKKSTPTHSWKFSRKKPRFRMRLPERNEERIQRERRSTSLLGTASRRSSDQPGSRPDFFAELIDGYAERKHQIPASPRKFPLHPLPRDLRAERENSRSRISFGPTARKKSSCAALE